jgi:hypothetical protein
MRLTPEQCKQRRQVAEEMVRTGASDSQFSVLYRRELDALDTINALTAERDVARWQALREAAELTTTLDPRHDDIHGLILALLSKSDAEALAEHDIAKFEEWIPQICNGIVSGEQNDLDQRIVAAIAAHDQSTRENYRADLITEGWIGPMQAEQVAAEARRQMITRLYHVANGYEQGGHTHRANAFRALAHELEGVNRLAALPASGQAEGKQP